MDAATVSTPETTEISAERAAQLAASHEALRGAQRRYRAANPARYAEHRRSYYERNKEAINGRRRAKRAEVRAERTQNWLTTAVFETV